MGRRGAFEWVPFRYSAEVSARKGEGAVVGVRRSAGAGTMFFQGGISWLFAFRRGDIHMTH